MSKIYNVGDLRKALEQFNDNDALVVEIHEGFRSEDLYCPTIDFIGGLLDENGNEFNEVRLCI